MSSRDGGKKKPLTQPKKGKKEVDDKDLKIKPKQKDEQKAPAEAKEKLSGKGPIGVGNKKLAGKAK